MLRLAKGFLTFTLLASLAIVPLPGYAKPADDFQGKPLNPEFVRWSKQNGIRSLASDGDYALGYRPGPVNTTVPRNQDVRLRTRLPESFDLREEGRVTPVRNQGTCGACWTFASLAPLESALLPSEEWDFSENNLRNNHGFDWDPCDGGNELIASANLARWNGPVLEADDPYRDDENQSVTGLKVQKHTQEVLFLPERTNYRDNDLIKQSIMEHGGLYVGLYMDNANYNTRTAGYYSPKAIEMNHAVTIVGWDDNYDRKNFRKRPIGNGAFIAKNSWGTEFGDEGYFYISYFDKTISSFTAFPKPESNDNYQNLYYYDELGWTFSLGSPDEDDTGWLSNIFTAKDDEVLKAVSFFTTGHDASYEIYIYTGVTPEEGPLSGELAGKVTKGKLALMGYHTVKLKEPVHLKRGSSFAVVVKMSVPGEPYPIALETPIDDYSSQATAEENQSFVSLDGEEWLDVTSIFPDSNVTIKAFTDDEDADKQVSQLTVMDGQDRKKILKLTVRQNSEPATFLIKATYDDKSQENVSGEVTLVKNSKPSVADVEIEDERITVIPKSHGNARLTFTYGDKKASILILVR